MADGRAEDGRINDDPAGANPEGQVARRRYLAFAHRYTDALAANAANPGIAPKTTWAVGCGSASTATVIPASAARPRTRRTEAGSRISASTPANPAIEQISTQVSRRSK